MGQLTKAMSRATIKRLKSLGKNKPKRSTLRETVRQIMAERSSEETTMEAGEQQEDQTAIDA